MTVRIVTDSSAILPPEAADRFPIATVPLAITWEGHDFANGELTYEGFLERTAEADGPPKTAAPSPGAYREACERALEDADAVVIVTPAGEVSATLSNANLAADMLDEGRVRVVDSRTAAAGQGLVVAEAARVADTGADLDATASRAAEIAERVRLWATLENLDYLRRSGRVPAVAAMATGALDLHPLFRFERGSPHATGVARGKRRAADKLIDTFSASRPDDGGSVQALCFHASRSEEAEALAERIRSDVEGAEVGCVQVGAAMAAHVGPGLLGIAWWWATGDDPPRG